MPLQHHAQQNGRLPTHFDDKLGVLAQALLGANWREPGPAVDAYERAYEKLFPGARAFAFWKGRVALHVGLRAMGIGRGDEVIMPGYTCSMVPGAILYAGAKPIYVDIRADDFNIDPDRLDAARTPNTRAVIVQHTYGFPADMDRIAAWADRNNLPVIEDCCHALGCDYNGRRLGTFGKFAFFSSQWNKHYTTALGGVLIVNDADLAGRVAALIDREAVAPSRKQVWMLAAQMLAHHMLVYPRTILVAQSIFRWLTARGFVVGSASKEEFDTRIPPNYVMLMSDLQARVGLCELARLGRNVKHRRKMCAYYRTTLGLEDAVQNGQPLVRFPLRVQDRPHFLAAAARSAIEVGTWFECPLHPIETDQEAFGYHDGDCPVAEDAARHMVNLPTHVRVSPAAAKRIAAFVKNYRADRGNRPPAAPGAKPSHNH